MHVGHCSSHSNFLPPLHQRATPDLFAEILCLRACHSPPFPYHAHRCLVSFGEVIDAWVLGQVHWGSSASWLPGYRVMSHLIVAYCTPLRKHLQKEYQQGQGASPPDAWTQLLPRNDLDEGNACWKPSQPGRHRPSGGLVVSPILLFVYGLGILAGSKIKTYVPASSLFACSIPKIWHFIGVYNFKSREQF